MICGSGGSEPAGHRSDEKLHAVVGRSTFPSQNVQSTPGSDHFWKLRCRKNARRCGAKHISKSKVWKNGGLGPLLEAEMSKKCTPLWREAHFEVKSVKNWRSRTTFGSWDVKKVHAIVARSTFWSQSVQNTPFWDHFWGLRCWKSARRCGAKHISKSKCTKHLSFGPLLEVQMSKKWTPLWREAHFQVKMYKTHHSRTTFEVEMLKKCTPLWREAHFQVKMYKTHHSRTTFGSWDVEKVHAVVARSTFRSQNEQSTSASDHFWRFRCRFASLHYTTLHYTTLHYTTLHYTTLQLQLHNYTPLQSTTLNFTTLHYITLHSTTLHDITLHCTTFHYTSLHYTPLHYSYNYNYNYTTTLHYTTLHYTKLHYTTLHYNTLHYTPLH